MTTTKFRSYSQLNIPALDAQVLREIESGGALYRKEISDRTGRRLSSICGAVNRLLKNELIVVSGVSTDPDTNRLVETVAINVRTVS